MGGLFVGKCSPESLGKVPTLFMDNLGKYYYGGIKYIPFKFGYTDTPYDPYPMLTKGPELLAFWSEDD